MRKLFIILIITFSSVNAQEKMKINESTKKYEMIYIMNGSKLMKI